ncbi:hypothetical protein LO80_02770 [Candidatus Francisella endociliophora]|uniref:Lipoprotein n=1 Tax=Candidatus Francisella endociliophora TaxID=653937 RepID=A0A097EN64_9GAMM|nr:hypothetical protein [Francisella sp. FSC1006]AIT09004.1 hypothetical protein LO80_02770 [Francisella sp. FSC1006]
MRLFKIVFLLSFLISLNSCSTLAFAPMMGAETVKSTFPKKLSEEATKEQQEEVKAQVMKLLEEEYKQPFKLESFDYKYETHVSSNSIPANYYKYGTYYFKVQAVDNPIIIMDFIIDDDSTTKETIKPLITSFKKKQLNTIYCSSFGTYWKEHKNDKNNIALEKTKKYCDARGQTEDYDNFWTQ